MMIDYPAQTACWNTRYSFQLRRAAQEDHFPTGKSSVARLGHITEKRIPGSIDMIIDRIFGNRYIFYPAGGSAGFGKINGFAFPKHILFPFLYLFNIDFELLIIPDWHCLGKGSMIRNRFQLMFFSENGTLTCL